MSKSLPYTLTILCPSQGAPGFLRHLQQSDVNPLWVGEYPRFYRKYNPSKWPWSHAMLTEGHGVRLPVRCHTMQTWLFEIDADQPLALDVDSMTDDGSANFDNEVDDSCGRPVRTRRFCALNFLASQAMEDEQKYKQHLIDVAEQHRDLDMRIQLTGHISNIKENLGSHAKIPKVPAKSKKKKKKRYLTYAELVAIDNGATIEDLDKEAAATSAPPAETPPPPATFFALLSFPSDKEYEEYMKREENHAKTDDGVKEEIILAKHLYIPPKGKPICQGDWSYGNPYEPYGQDWFG